MLRTISCCAIGLMVCGTALPFAPARDWGTAHAQAKKKSERAEKKSPAKDGPGTSQERTPFTPADENAAGIPGIPDARVWGDSESDFARVVPQASGPWLAISGGVEPYPGVSRFCPTPKENRIRRRQHLPEAGDHHVS